MASEKSKILVIGGTGHIGKFIVEASVKAGHTTFVLVRKASLSDPVKGKIIQNFKDLGVTSLIGDLNDHESLVKAIKQVDVVISTVGSIGFLDHFLDQTTIISAIKEAGNIKRFLPSEFGVDVDRTSAVEPAKSFFAKKIKIRRAVEAEGIPYTFVAAGLFADYYLPTLMQFGPGMTSPPRDKVEIYGDGNPKVVMNKEEDIAAYTIKAVNDPRTLNKILYIKPPKNTLSNNEMVKLWEKKIDKTLQKTYIPEKEILKSIPDAPDCDKVDVAIAHAIFVKGDQTNFVIEPSFGVEASELYPDVKYTSIDEYLSFFA